MRARLVIAALVVTAVASAYGCTLPLDGIPTEGSGGRAATSTTSSAGGASMSSTTGSTASASTGPGPECMLDTQCPAGTMCETPVCTQGVCGFETASHDAMDCAAPTSECFDASQCKDGACVPRPKPPGTILNDGVPANCTSLSCDGMGNSTKVADPSDPQPDGDPSDCTVPICDGMTPATKSKNNLDGCGALLNFCWSGSCVECAFAVQCPGSADSCSSAACNGGQCGYSMTPDNTGCTVSGAAGKCMGGGCCAFNKVCGSICCPGAMKCMNGACKP
jgi:hypothetical protein